MFKKISFKKGYYKEIQDITAILPVTWVQCDLCIGSLYKGFTNYWTIIPNTITNKKWVINNEKYVDSIYIFNDLILITLDNVSIIPEFNIISWQELYKQLNNLIGIVFNETSNVRLVCKLLEIQHPKFATIKSIYFKTVNDDNYLQATIEKGVDLFRYLEFPFHGISKIINNENVWNDALTKFLYDFGESNITPKLKYESNLGELLEENIEKVIKILNQFK